jgi:AraC-like DNA-binding protein
MRYVDVKRLLLSAGPSVSFVAETVGYSGTTHFNRMFKQHTGMRQWVSGKKEQPKGKHE